MLYHQLGHKLTHPNWLKHYDELVDLAVDIELPKLGQQKQLRGFALKANT